MGAITIFKFAVWYVFVASALFFEVETDSSCDVEVEETLRTLLNPQENDSIQLQALRRQLLRKFQEALDLAELEDDRNYKRTLAAWNNLPDEHKRNLEALARSGTWYKTLPDTLQSEDTNYKRSIANLAKNGQLPLMFLQHENQKRGIEALARNGDLLRRQNFRDIKDVMEDFYDKRNIGSLVRTYNYPLGGGMGKRSVSSLARLGELPYYPKRNIQSLARDRQIIGKRNVDNYQEQTKDTSGPSSEKRNIQSIKAQYKQSNRNKRQTDLSYVDDNNNEGIAYQTGKPYDYDDFIQDLAAEDVYSVEDKRFLGSLAKTGWFKPADRGGITQFTSQPEKRHVAALARLGWLPSYRSVRRYTRSGRSTGNSNDDTCRETSTNGKAQNYSYSKITSVPLEDKRYLLQPAVDNIILRKMFTHPRVLLH